MRSLRALAISADGETLYAASLGGGLFRLSTHTQAEFDALTPQTTSEPTPQPTEESATERPAAREPGATEPASAPAGVDRCPASFVPLAAIPLALVIRVRSARAGWRAK
jgi:hypothetical protein